MAITKDNEFEDVIFIIMSGEIVGVHCDEVIV